MSDFNVTPNTELAKAYKAYATNPENMKNHSEGKQVSVFNFLGDKFKNAKPEQKPEIYQNGILSFAAGQIALSDKNGDGAMDYQEYEAEQLDAYKQLYNETASTELTGMKDIMLEDLNSKDANGDGIISGGEYVDAETKAILDYMPGATTDTKQVLKNGFDKQHAERLKTMDTNGDNILSEDEFIVAQSAEYEKMFGKKPDFTPIDLGGELKKTFSNQDLNDDGKLTKDEIAAGVAYMDKDQEGRINGELEYGDVVGTPWDNSKIKGKLQETHKFLFGQ